MQKSRASSQVQRRERKFPSKLTVRPSSLAFLMHSRMKSAQLGDRAGVMPLRCSQSKSESSQSRSTLLKSYSVMALCLRS